MLRQCRWERHVCRLVRLLSVGAAAVEADPEQPEMRVMLQQVAREMLPEALDGRLEDVHVRCHQAEGGPATHQAASQGRGPAAVRAK